MDTDKVLTKVVMPALCLFLAAVLASPASADVTYTYTGEAFTEYDNFPTGGPTTADYISGSVTLSAAIPPSTTDVIMHLGGYSASLVSYTFTDNFTTWSISNFESDAYPYLALTTDAFGAVTSWFADIYYYAAPTATFPSNNAPEMVIQSSTGVFSSYGYDVALWNELPFGFPSPVYEAASGTAGTWTTVPEPSTMLMLGSGLLGLAGLWRRFKK